MGVTVGHVPMVQSAAAVWLLEPAPSTQPGAAHWLDGYTQSPLPVRQAVAPQVPPVVHMVLQQKVPRQRSLVHSSFPPQLLPAPSTCTHAPPIVQ